MIKRILYLVTISFLVACSLPTRPPVGPTTWMVSPDRTSAPRQARTDIWLKMGSVSVTSPFDGKSLVYRTSEQGYEKDFYNVYVTIPAEMIGNAGRQWINKANIFSSTVGQSNSLFPYYYLQATVEEFYGDYRKKPEAVVSVEFFLSATGAGKANPLIGSNRYTKRVALKDNSPEALVLGLQDALAQILGEYENQLYKYAGNLPKPLGQ